MLATEEQDKTSLRIHFAKSNVETTGDNQSTLLDQAEQAGINIPYSCRGGKCGRCKTKLLSGEVKVLNDQGLFKNEIADGYILACSSIPETDISIEQ
jgi:ferredoxin